MTTHKAATELLADNDYAGALCIAGSLLEGSPGDLTAWYLVCRALNGLGEQETAIKNMKTVAAATARNRRPIQALAQMKEVAEWGGDTDDLLTELARLYGSGAIVWQRWR